MRRNGHRSIRGARFPIRGLEYFHYRMTFAAYILLLLLSHTRTVVRECFKGDEASQWKRPKIRPLATPKPLNRSPQKLAGVITSWTEPGIQNFVSIGSGVSVPQIRDFAVLLV